MQHNNLRVFLGVNYNTVIGESVYVVGSIPELGNWNPDRGFSLNYHQEGNWSNALNIERKSIVVEYKYVIKNHNTNETRWEEGVNRILNLKSVSSSKKEIFNIESWNHREVNIRLKYDSSSKSKLAVFGEGASLGNWKTPNRMSLVSKRDPVNGQKTMFWEWRFFVRHDMKRIKYRLVQLDDQKGTLTWEREPDRVCDFVTLTTLSPYKRYESNPNKKDCIKFAKKHNRFVKIDCNFVSEFCFDEITSNITIGPYPQNKTEIECLKSHGIKAVLNLQTKSDMKYRFLDWDERRRDYFENNMKVVNFSILDMSAEDIRFKAYDGANILNELINRYKKVYVHCTAGIWRAPHIVAAYLNFYQEYTAEQAVELIKDKRPVVYLSKELLQKAYKNYEKKMKAGNAFFVNGGVYTGCDAASSKLVDERIANKVEQNENKGYQLGSALREVRFSSGRNL